MATFSNDLEGTRPSDRTEPTSYVGRRPVWRSIMSSAPAGAVFLLLFSVGLIGYWTDWRLPSASTFWSPDSPSEGPWCADHNVPEAICIECTKTASGKKYPWCETHGLAECPLEHPEIAQTKEVPEVTASALQRAQTALSVRARKENNRRCKLHERIVQFASADAVDQAGIDIDVVHERPVLETIQTNAELIYDQTRLAHLSSRAPGTMVRVEKQVGEQVHRGDTLALVDAAEVGNAKSSLLQALAAQRLAADTLNRLQPLVTSGAVTGRQLRETETAVEQAHVQVLSAEQALVNLGLPVKAEEFAGVPSDQIAERLRFLGISQELVAQFDPESASSNLLPLRAPLDGIITERLVAAGEVVDTSTQLLTVVDLSQIWLVLHVREDNIGYLAMGQKVLFQPSNDPTANPLTSKISWIGSEVNSETRTIEVRGEVLNPDGRLKANTFGTGRIVLREEPLALVVPTEAVNWEGCCQIVFVRDKDFLQPETPKFFHVRKVRVGVREGNSTEIIAGLMPGEVVASKNSVLLRAQLLKSNLGAGCCESH